MSDSVEYLFALDSRRAEDAARKQGWHPHGRSAWIKPDGTVVYFVCFAEQLAIIDKGVKIYFVGELTRETKRFKLKWVKLRA